MICAELSTADCSDATPEHELPRQSVLLNNISLCGLIRYIHYTSGSRLADDKYLGKQQPNAN